MNQTEITMKRPCCKKTHLRAHNRFKWASISFQGQILTSTIFRNPGGSPLQVKFWVVENLLAIDFFPKTIHRGELANIFVSSNISRTKRKQENQSLDDVLDFMDKSLGRFNEASHINILHVLVDLYNIWTEYQVPLAAHCSEQQLKDNETLVRWSIWPKCENGPELEITSTRNLENTEQTREWRANEPLIWPASIHTFFSPKKLKIFIVRPDTSLTKSSATVNHQFLTTRQRM